MRTSVHTIGALALLSFANAQFPSTVKNLTVIESKINPAVKLSFKKTSICERTPGVKAYSGYVHLPGSILSDVGGFDINTYFLYFEARKNASTAPLGIYLAGGPGESSVYAAIDSESGPCYVNIDGTDTTTNPWSFNNEVNMLYIDQPVGTGFSYNGIINGTYDFLDQTGTIEPLDFDPSSPPQANATSGYGTYPNQSFELTANNTVQAAKMLWYFAEHWLSSFPGYNTDSQDISIWGNSYGGYWVPETAFQISKGLSNLSRNHLLECKELKIDSVGITNGCVDIQSAMLGYPIFAYKNTYGVQFVTEAEYEGALQNYNIPNGCRDLIEACRALGEEGDPNYTGSNATVNEMCEGAFGFCSQTEIAFANGINERWAFDVAETANYTCPFWYPAYQYLNNATTQQGLGVALNYTPDANVILQNFGLPSIHLSMLPPNTSTGDAVRQNGLPNIEYLLANDVKVAFIFGDRDYRCPWTGGEATALTANWTGQTGFSDAGYEMMQGVTTPIDQGGLRALVKQHGQFSFSRVMDAGHSVSAFAPETVYRIFSRTINGLDVVTGEKTVGKNYSTSGPTDSWSWRNKLPDQPPQGCMIEGQYTSTNPLDALIGAQVSEYIRKEIDWLED